MKQKLSDEIKAHYNKLLQALPRNTDNEKTLFRAVDRFSTSIRQALKEDDFPYDLDTLVQKVSVLLDKTTPLSEKAVALQDVLAMQEPPKQELASRVVEGTLTAAKGLVCLAWAAACVTALATYYVVTFPYGLAADLVVGAFLNQKPPLGGMMIGLAELPFEVAFSHETAQTKESTATTDLKEALNALKTALDAPVESEVEQDIEQQEQEQEEQQRVNPAQG